MAFDQANIGCANLTGLEIEDDQTSIQLLDILARGTDCVVYSAHGTTGDNSAQYFAVKCISKAGLDEEQLAQHYREIELHSKVSSRGASSVLKLHTAIEYEQYVFIILDVACGGDLYDAIHSHDIYKRDDATIRMAILQLIDGVIACHDAGVSHCDLQLENILCGSDGLDIRIADFGKSTIETSRRESAQGGHTSPEGLCLTGQSYSTHNADIWSLGIAIFSIITGQALWSVASDTDPFYAEFLLDHFSIFQGQNLSGHVEEMVIGLLHSNPDYRTPLSELRERVVKIKSFFLTEKEIDNFAKFEAFRQQCAESCSMPSSPVVDDSPEQSIFDATWADDEEYTFDAPDADVFIDNFTRPRQWVVSTHQESRMQHVLFALHVQELEAQDQQSWDSSSDSDSSSEPDSEGPTTPEYLAFDPFIQIAEENNEGISRLDLDEHNHFLSSLAKKNMY
ncbi:hypothetical protein HWV62_17700 [Athelia sp. TMB]|nr:hypothetical protein HWV62_17700 [Athelia sp. TMB]